MVRHSLYSPTHYFSLRIPETAFDPREPYYDPKSDRENPKWYLVHVEFRRKFRRLIGLQELKRYKDKELKEMPLLKTARLSVSAVPKGCWEFIGNLEKMDEER
jgi:predicted RNA-binding protein with PUA-like domain